MAASIQFRGVEQVMQAFQNRDVDAWSVWQHKQFMFKGFGDAALRTLLENLAQGATNAIYTIKVYEDIQKEDDIVRIKEKTECDGSFNFRINADGQEITGSQYYGVNRYQTLENEIQELKRQIQEKNDITEDEPETIGSVAEKVVIDVIQNPNKALQWMDVIKQIFSFNPNQPAHGPAMVRQIPAQPAAVGNITEVKAEPIDEAKWERIYKAVEILEAADPKCMEHLEQLAIMTQDKPAKFKSLLLMLETF